jgi:hypothetical protein
MKLELSKSQYRSLVKLAFLGNWMANSTKLHEEQDQEFNEITQLVYSLSKEIEPFDLVEYDKRYKEYFPTRKLEEELEDVIEEYDNDAFWQELSSRLARRDLLREIGPVSTLTDKHREREFEIEEAYQTEFEKNGLKNLVLKEQKSKKR